MTTPTPQPNVERMRAVGRQLASIHDDLRAQLAAARTSVDAYLAGTVDADDVSAKLDLRQHCLAFCDSMHHHHTGEDSLAFPYLAEQLPELRPAIERLRQEHVVVVRIVRESPGPVRQQTAVVSVIP